MNKKSIYFALFLIGFILSRDLDLAASRFNINSGNDLVPFTHLIGIMVDFQSDVDSETSGDGKFLINQNIDLSYINYIIRIIYVGYNIRVIYIIKNIYITHNI